ncbi:MAG: DNA repair protein RecO [Bacteroidaceae bacterium]|nr:DNA repair protein RecO [Bacteroidaceae bacterium]
MLEKTQGIVLRTLKYNDESVIVDIYTANNGSQGFIVRLPRSRKNPVRAILLRPLSILNLEYDYRPHRALQFMRNMQVAEPYHSLPYEPLKETVGLFLSEFLYYALKNEERNPPLFQYLRNGLLWFDEAQRAVANFHLVFLIRLTRFLGFWPDIAPDSGSLRKNAKASHSGVFDLREGVMTDVVPMHSAWLSPEESALTPLLLRMDFHTMHLFRLNREQRRRILDVLTDYYRLHVPEFPELKSLEILREVVGGG